MDSNAVGDLDVEQLKLEIKHLKSERGECSRAIGDAKKAGQPCAELIQQVSGLSHQIKGLETQLKILSASAETDLQENDQPKPLPPQFQPITLKKDSRKEIFISDSIQNDEWDAYVEQHPNATIYHSTAIRRTIQNSFGHQSHYLAARIPSGELVGVLPLIEMNSRLFGHFLTSMPFFNYGGLLASSESAAQCLLKHAAALASTLGVEHIEMRHTRNNLQLPAKSEKVAMLLDLPRTIDQLWSDIGTKVRAQIKKAQRSETRIEFGREELVDDFYRVFSRNMRDLGTPVYSRQLFVEVIKYCTSAQIACVYLDNRPVSAGFLLGWRNTLEIPWASTIREANRFDVNMLLYWEILQYAIESGYRVFDFGRSSRNASTYKFKKQWGARDFDLYWHYWLPDGAELPQLNPNNPKYRLLIKVWQKLPLPIANLLGPGIVKQLP